MKIKDIKPGSKVLTNFGEEVWIGPGFKRYRSYFETEEDYKNKKNAGFITIDSDVKLLKEEEEDT